MATMRYKITHTTTYVYGEPVLVSQNQAMLTPRTGHGQSCRLHRLLVRPVPSSTSWRTDYFGNVVCYFAIHHGHRRLRVSAASMVRVRPRRLPPPEQTDISMVEKNPPPYYRSVARIGQQA